MQTERYYVACDLGADSGRVILGRLNEGRLTLEEIHRFSNGPAKVAGSLRWDVIRLFEELKVGLRKLSGRNIAGGSLSVDSWGVDYVLFNERQPLLSLPYHYRDERTEKTFGAALKAVGAARIFAETGIQFLPFNTLYQLIADVEQNSDLLALADQFLNIGDYLNFLFCGVARAETSMASTTQIFNPRTNSWSKDLIEASGIPAHIFPKIVPSGTKLGPLTPKLALETGLAGFEVIATCSHDTGAAVAAVPAQGDDWAYLSSGTWSLIGVELPTPLINDAVREQNFTNEAGYGGTTRFLKNIVGLWILQECRRTWASRGEHLDYAEIDCLAEKAEPFRSLINPNAARFLSPGEMPEKIAAYCRETRQPIPETPGQIARCIFESLALLYQVMLEKLEQLTDRNIARLHIVGGGSKSEMINQFTANATGRTVLSGPVEATAIGNVMIQALALGHIDSLNTAREMVRLSFAIKEYQPQERSSWQRVADRFAALKLTT